MKQQQQLKDRMQKLEEKRERLVVALMVAEQINKLKQRRRGNDEDLGLIDATRELVNTFKAKKQISQRSVKQIEEIIREEEEKEIIEGVKIVGKMLSEVGWPSTFFLTQQHEESNAAAAASSERLEGVLGTVLENKPKWLKEAVIRRAVAAPVISRFRYHFLLTTTTSTASTETAQPDKLRWATKFCLDILSSQDGGGKWLRENVQHKCGCSCDVVHDLACDLVKEVANKVRTDLQLIRQSQQQKPTTTTTTPKSPSSLSPSSLKEESVESVVDSYLLFAVSELIEFDNKLHILLNTSTTTTTTTPSSSTPSACSAMKELFGGEDETMVRCWVNAEWHTSAKSLDLALSNPSTWDPIPDSITANSPLMMSSVVLVTSMIKSLSAVWWIADASTTSEPNNIKRLFAENVQIPILKRYIHELLLIRPKGCSEKDVERLCLMSNACDCCEAVGRDYIGPSMAASVCDQFSKLSQDLINRVTMIVVDTFSAILLSSWPPKSAVTSAATDLEAVDVSIPMAAALETLVAHLTIIKRVLQSDPLCFKISSMVSSVVLKAITTPMLKNNSQIAFDLTAAAQILSSMIHTPIPALQQALQLVTHK